MARPLRLEFLGALYHVTVRGNRKSPIFVDDFDRRLFLKTFGEVIKTHNWVCHAFCLMDNHFHLAIETVDGNLSDGMHDLNGIYTQRFNKRHGLVGHLFQGRFKACLIEKETYLLAVARYIVLNPVRAGVVKRSGEWSWSSYRAMAGVCAPPKWLTIDWLLQMFSKDRQRAQKMYREFVDEGVGKESPLKQIGKGGILGSDQFVYEVWEHAQHVEELADVSRAQRMVGRPTLEDIFSQVDEGDRQERNRAIGFARLRCCYSVAEIARFLKISTATVSLAARNISQKKKSKR